jgi:putative ATP-dependent endonuclease of OLD family
MKISELSWNNYRRLPDDKLNVRNHLVLVGPNDSGKSSIVRALHLCLGMGHGQLSAAISPRDFTDPTVPLTLTVTLDGIDDDDRAAFPDEITTGPPEHLAIVVEATLDPTDPDQRFVRRFFPDAGHSRAPTKEQLASIAFQFVPAARSLLRELGGASGGAVRSLLSGLDLTADAAALDAAAAAYRTALDGSLTLQGFRSELASALTDALPDPVLETDVRVMSEAEILSDPLSGVSVTVDDGGHHVPLSEQSDGIRALSVLTILGMSHKSARIVAVDEPETHLHPTAQRSLAKSLRSGAGQRVLVTHSPSIVGQMDPMDIAAFRADKHVRQLPPGAEIAQHDKEIRHWSHRLVEPLTARRVVLVEGASDQILFERAAELSGVNLDRKGVAVFDLGGAGLFGLAYAVFGPLGFDIPLNGLVDEDARDKWAAAVGVIPADLEAAGYVVCDPDLEGAYIDALGVSVILSMLTASPSIGPTMLLQSSGATALAMITRDQLWEFCKRHKVPAAIAVSDALTAPQVGSITPINDLLQLIQ